MTDAITDTVDWNRIADRLQQVMADMVHRDTEARYGTDYYAEALRRTLGYEPGDGPRRESLRRGDGLTTEAYAKNLYDTSGLDRMHREQAEEQVKEMRAEVARVYRDAAKDLAAFLRARCNERSVPSRYRREGVTWAADMIDPAVPKDQYGQLRTEADAR